MKKIIISGSSGFIGRNIYKEITKLNYELEDLNLRKSLSELRSLYSKKIFDVFIHSAGIHPHRSGLNDEETYLETKKMLKKINIIFRSCKKIILISSFVNLINYNNKIITETNKIFTTKDDNYYKKSKILTEKYFQLLKRRYQKELIIIYPCHVIGPDDLHRSPNGIFLLNNYKKIISLYFDVNYPITDVREISNYTIYCIKNNLSSSQKILIDRNTSLLDYFKLFHTYKNKIKFYFCINKKFYYLIANTYKRVQNIFNLKKNYFPISTYNYLKLNPKVLPQLDISYKIKYKIEKTVIDTISYFKL